MHHPQTGQFIWVEIFEKINNDFQYYFLFLFVLFLDVSCSEVLHFQDFGSHRWIVHFVLSSIWQVSILGFWGVYNYWAWALHLGHDSQVAWGVFKDPHLAVKQGIVSFYRLVVTGASMKKFLSQKVFKYAGFTSIDWKVRAVIWCAHGGISHDKESSSSGRGVSWSSSWKRIGWWKGWFICGRCL